MNNIQVCCIAQTLDRLITFVRISRRELKGHGFSVQSIFEKLASKLLLRE